MHADPAYRSAQTLVYTRGSAAGVATNDKSIIAKVPLQGHEKLKLLKGAPPNDKMAPREKPPA
jgi:hypothetical protein